VEINAEEKEGGTVCVEVSDESAEVYISADVGY